MDNIRCPGEEMKKTIIIIVVLVFIGATLLSTLSIFSQNKPEPTEQPTATAIRTFALATTTPEALAADNGLSEEQVAYLNEIVEQKAICDTDGSAFFITIQQAQQGSGEVSDDEFVTQLVEELDAFSTYCTHFGNENAPQGMETIQANLENANEAYILFVENFITGLEGMDQTYIDKSDQYLQEGNQYIQLANDEMEELAN